VGRYNSRFTQLDKKSVADVKIAPPRTISDKLINDKLLKQEHEVKICSKLFSAISTTNPMALIDRSKKT
jgi:hypothetical protein